MQSQLCRYDTHTHTHSDYNSQRMKTTDRPKLLLTSNFVFDCFSRIFVCPTNFSFYWFSLKNKTMSCRMKKHLWKTETHVSNCRYSRLCSCRQNDLVRNLIRFMIHKLPKKWQTKTIQNQLLSFFVPYLSSSNAQKIGLWNRSSWRTISEQNNWNESNSWTIGNEFRQRRVEVEWNSKNKVHIFRQWKRLNRTATLFTYLPACYGQRCLCVCDSIRMMVQQYWKQYAYTQNRTAWTKRRLLR